MQALHNGIHTNVFIQAAHDFTREGTQIFEVETLSPLFAIVIRPRTLPLTLLSIPWRVLRNIREGPLSGLVGGVVEMEDVARGGMEKILTPSDCKESEEI